MTEEREKKRDPGFYDGKSCFIAHRTPTHQKQGETKIPCHCAIALKDYNQMKFGKLLGRVEVGFSSKAERRLNVYKAV